MRFTSYIPLQGNAEFCGCCPASGRRVSKEFLPPPSRAASVGSNQQVAEYSRAIEEKLSLSLGPFRYYAKSSTTTSRSLLAATYCLTGFDELRPRRSRQLARETRTRLTDIAARGSDGVADVVIFFLISQCQMVCRFIDRLSDFLAQDLFSNGFRRNAV